MLVVAAIVFRLPRLVNAADMNADYGIIGLQAMHVLRGEWGLHLWGADYQSSLEPFLVAGLFAVFGAKPVLLLIEPLLAFLLQMTIVHDVLRRRVSRVSAFVGVLPLVIAPWSMTWLSLYGPRQLAVTMVFFGIWLFDRASDRRRRRPYLFAAGAFVSALSVHVDLLSLQLLPAVAVFALLCAFDGEATIARAIGRSVMFTLGAGAGLLALTFVQPGGTPGGPGCLSIDHVPANAHLLWDQCLPAAVALKVYVPGKDLYPTVWSPPGWFGIVQIIGAGSVSLAYLGTQASLVMRIPWEIRRLAFLALVAVAACFGSFLVGCRIGDMWAMRYLAPITWFLPFALSPALHRFPRLTPAFLAPYLVSSMVGGWVAYGPAVRGPLITITPRGAAQDERWLAEGLRRRGVHHAAAQYFLSYRLSFLWREDPLVVPIEAGADRYPPHRQAFDTAETGAYVFHPSEPRALPETYEALLQTQKIPFERETIAGFPVIIFHRPPAQAPPSSIGAGH